MFVGADGCEGGWFAVTLTENGRWSVAIFKDIRGLWETLQSSTLILIDVPIGLPDTYEQKRLCDIEARAKLMRRRSSVFPAPCRPIVYADSYEEASRIKRQMTGKTRGVSRQVWGIIPKIREGDALLIEEKSARSHIREVHPEICFWALAGGKSMEYSKKKPEGQAERQRLLESVFPNTGDPVDHALCVYRRKQVAIDDILDALAAAVTATAGPDKLSTLPEAPEMDSRGLPMGMLYQPS